MRNFALNGAMRFDQNHEGGIYYSDPNTEVYSLDQWRFCGGTSGIGRFSMQRMPIPYNFHGFDFILQAASTVQQTVLSATDNMHIEYPIEGCNISPWEFGGANAKDITVSFQFIATVAGEFSFTLMNGINTRSYVTSFIYTNASVPQYITITIPGDVAGDWATDECTFGAKFIWSLGVGSMATTSNTEEWQAAAYWNKDGSTQIMQDVANTSMYITGFQVELGSEATPFEFLTYTQELLLLQRYYFKTIQHGLPVAGGQGATGAVTYYSKKSGVNSDGVELYIPVSMAAPNAPVSFYSPINGSGLWYNATRNDNSGMPFVVNQSDNKLFIGNPQAILDGNNNLMSVHVVVNSRLGGS
jgi:hypothetical protein